MPDKRKVSLDELLDSRKAISDDNGVIYKAHVAPRSWNDEERSAIFVMSAETSDSYGDVVVQAGIDRAARFDANPVALFGHRSWDMPVGDWTDIRVVRGSPKRTEGKLIFSEEGVDETADRVARNVKANKLRAASIGFTPKSYERIFDEKGEWTYGYKFLEVELYECSVVTIPAVREALIKGAGGKAEDIVSPEVIEEFLQHLKANPALAKMINRDLYEGVYREITGNKTSLQIEAPAWIGEVRSLAERIEKAAGQSVIVVNGPIDDATLEKMKSAMAAHRGSLEHGDEPPVDEIAKELEANVEAFLKDVQPKVDELDEPERKGTLTKLMEGIRGLFKPAPEPEVKEPAVEPIKADPEVQKALSERLAKIAERHKAAA